MKLKLLDFPDQQVTVEDIAKDGVFYRKIETANDAWKEPLEALCKERSYKNRDEVFISLNQEVKPEDRTFTTGKQNVLTRDNDKLDTMLTKFYEE